MKLRIPRRGKDIAERLIRWFLGNARDLPWRRTLDPYAIWISEIMLQQTQVKTVIPYFERWMAAFPDIKTLAKAPPLKVIKAWEGLGYYSRARNAHAAAKMLSGAFPNEFERVLALPGIGPYTAGAICSIAFNQSTAILDGNVARVLSRIFAIRHEPKSARGRQMLWQIAQELVTDAAKVKHRSLQPANAAIQIAGACSALNQSLMELGALICTPRGPKCSLCPVRKSCAAHRQNCPEAFPRVARRPNSVPQNFVVLIFESKKRYLVRQRSKGEVNGGFWEFPNLEVPIDWEERAASIAKILKRCPRPAESLGHFNHSIMNRRIRLDAFLIRNAARQRKSSGKWLTMSVLKKLPIAGAHRKILRRLQTT